MSRSRYAIIRKRLISLRVTRRLETGFATAVYLDEQKTYLPHARTGEKIVNRLTGGKKVEAVFVVVVVVSLGGRRGEGGGGEKRRLNRRPNRAILRGLSSKSSIVPFSVELKKMKRIKGTISK